MIVQLHYTFVNFGLIIFIQLGQGRASRDRLSLIGFCLLQQAVIEGFVYSQKKSLSLSGPLSQLLITSRTESTRKLNSE